MPDAEWYMQNAQGLMKFCYEHSNDPANSFLVLLQNENKSLQFYTQRLFKAHKGIRFEGAVHEAINQGSSIAVPEDTYILWKPSAFGAEKSRQRWSRDLQLLLQDIQEHPKNSRTAFYLAQTYECLGDLQNAEIWYTKR